MDFHFCHDDRARYRPDCWPYALDYDFALWLSTHRVVEVRRRADFICFMSKHEDENKNWQGDAYWYQGFDADMHQDSLELSWQLGDAAKLKFNVPYRLDVRLSDDATQAVIVAQDNYDFRTI